ncbi:MAG: HEAT repeat domain-containing protein [Deltaproteobacteria bacterium]|nr:HEAT repeat domain-containing protein [Deltaproteobacteria bacterium]
MKTNRKYNDSKFLYLVPVFPIVFSIFFGCSNKPGVTNAPASMSLTRQDKATLAALDKTIAKAKAGAMSGYFGKVDLLMNRVPYLKKTKRGRFAVVTPLLESIGSSAALPMIEKLRHKEKPGGFSESSWIAWRIGLLEALSDFKDKRALIVAKDILLDPNTGEPVARAAASAIGTLGGEQESEMLISIASKKDEKGLAVLTALGRAREPNVIEFLGRVMSTDTDRARIKAAVRSMRTLANKWAWRSGSLGTRDEQEEFQQKATRKLLIGFKAHFQDPLLNEEFVKALEVVDWPGATGILDAMMEHASSQGLQKALSELKTRLENNPLNRK